MLKDRGLDAISRKALSGHISECVDVDEIRELLDSPDESYLARNLLSRIFNSEKVEFNITNVEPEAL